MTPSLRRAIETVALQRGVELDQDDVEAFVEAVARARGLANEGPWVDDVEAMHLSGRTNVDSLRAYCSRHNVTRMPMTNRHELDKAVRGMPGRGHYPRHQQQEE